MPQLLNTDQIDGFFVWQPYVAMAREGGMGKILTYSEDLPPIITGRINPAACLS
ncbi:MAG: hypothetical protein STSR0009_09150 [Methanoregula sp.]